VVGDFDQDGDADDGDLAIWQQTFGTQDPSALPGDADGNRIVDGFDFLAWQQNLGAPALPAFAAASAAATAARSVVAPSHHDAVLTNLAAESARTLLFPDATPSAQGSTKAEVETPHTAFAASTISDQPAPQITETAHPKRTRQAQGSSLDAAIDAVLQRAGVDDWRAWRSRL
jgi:hypothetical protein